MDFSEKSMGENKIGSGSLPLKGGDSKKLILVVIILLIAISLGAYFFIFGSPAAVPEVPAFETVEQAVEGSTMASETEVAVNAGDAVVSQNETLLVPAKSTTTGVTVGGMFIPSGLNRNALDFLSSLESKGKLPIEIDKSALGKTDPFLKQ